jgi:putative hydrolase of the HAD superfamily
MTPITAIFFDIGGVILSNGWSEPERRRVVESFNLDYAAFDRRHIQVIDAFDYGHMDLETYLLWTVFYEPRTFSAQDFFHEIQRIMQPMPETLQVTEELRDSGKYLLATLNNEPGEINLYRIQHFGLPKIFSVFFSSCYLGVRKPQKGIFQKALQITQRQPEECLFIDDVLMNVEAAQDLGMHAIHFLNAAQLRESLKQIGVM